MSIARNPTNNWIPAYEMPRLIKAMYKGIQESALRWFAAEGTKYTILYIDQRTGDFLVKAGRDSRSLTNEELLSMWPELKEQEVKPTVTQLLASLAPAAAAADDAWFASELAKKPAPGMKFEVNSRAIGPKHDWYDETTITVTYGPKKAEFLQNGLGTSKVTLYKDGAVVGTIEDRHDDPTNRLNMRKMFAYHVGITVEGARDAYDAAYQQDPIGDQR